MSEGSSAEREYRVVVPGNYGDDRVISGLDREEAERCATAWRKERPTTRIESRCGDDWEVA